MGVVEASGERVGTGQPEAAGHEGILIASHTVGDRLGAVAQHQTIAQQVTFDRRQGAQHARVIAGKEPDDRNHQQGRIHLGGVIVLGEGVRFGVEATFKHGALDGVAQFPPALDRSIQAVFLNGADRLIESHPGHHPGLGVMMRRPAGFPQAAVRFIPRAGQMLQQHQLHIPGVRGFGEAGIARLPQSQHHLTDHVALLLGDRAVADPHRTRIRIARQVRQFSFGQVACSVHGVHDLDVFGIPGHGAH